MEDKLTKERWDKIVEQMMNYGKLQSVSVYTTNDINQAQIPFNQEYDTKIISPFIDWDKKVFVVLEWDDEFETARVRATFTDESNAKNFIDTNDRKAYLEVEETLIDAEVPVEKQS